MPDLPESSTNYPTGVRQIDFGERAYGGDPTKPPNEQFLALANRTAFLRTQADALNNQLQTANTQLNTLNGQIQSINTQIQAINAALNGLTIGEEVQAFSPILQAISGLTLVGDRLIGTNGAGAIRQRTIPEIAIAVLQDNKPDTTFAGGGNITAWLTRDLNTIETFGTSFCTLASNAFTLTAGSYFLVARTPATMVDKHQCRLFNVSDNLVQKVGSSNQTFDGTVGSGQSITTDSWVTAAFSLTTSKTFRIEQRIYAIIANRSLGSEVSSGSGEVYTQAVILRNAPSV